MNQSGAWFNRKDVFVAAENSIILVRRHAWKEWIETIRFNMNKRNVFGRKVKAKKLFTYSDIRMAKRMLKAGRDNTISDLKRIQRLASAPILDNRVFVSARDIEILYFGKLDMENADEDSNRIVSGMLNRMCR